jgi:hypothetical protein
MTGAGVNKKVLDERLKTLEKIIKGTKKICCKDWWWTPECAGALYATAEYMDELRKLIDEYLKTCSGGDKYCEYLKKVQTELTLYATAYRALYMSVSMHVVLLKGLSEVK